MEQVTKIVDPLQKSLRDMQEALNLSKEQQKEAMTRLDETIKLNMKQSASLGETATLLTKGNYIGRTELQQSMSHLQQPTETLTLRDEQTELQRIEAALKTANGNKSKAAQLLGVDRKTLYNKIKKYNL